MGFREQADKVGILGATFTALCCLGISAVVGAVSAVGLGFLINDAVLLPMLIAFLALTVWGLVSGWRRHGRPGALTLGAIAAVALLVSSFFIPQPGLAYTSIAALVAASVWNAAALYRRHD